MAVIANAFAEEKRRTVIGIFEGRAFVEIDGKTVCELRPNEAALGDD